MPGAPGQPLARQPRRTGHMIKKVEVTVKFTVDVEPFEAEKCEVKE